MQFAWLDLFGGRWLLLDGNLKYPARSWSNEEAALAQLREEGWTVKPVRRRRSQKKSCGYAAMRTVH